MSMFQDLWVFSVSVRFPSPVLRCKRRCSVSPPRCKVCPLTFLTKSEMQIHSKSHTEAKPHKCPHCSKTFANASYLAQHLRIHLGIKPYHCSYCENSFRQLSHLQQHTRSDHQHPPLGRLVLISSHCCCECSVCSLKYHRAWFKLNIISVFQPFCYQLVPTQNPHWRPAIQMRSPWMWKGFYPAVQPTGEKTNT